MKVIRGSLFRAICAIVLGVLLVMYPDKTTELLVVIVGCFFLVPGVVALLNYFTRSKSERRIFPTMGLGSVLLGLILILMPAFFVTFLMYVLGFALLLAGAAQVSSLLRMRRFTVVPVSLYVVPVLVLLAGLVIIVNPIEVAGYPFLILGVSSIVCGLSELWNAYKFRNVVRVTDVSTGQFEEAEEIKD